MWILEAIRLCGVFGIRAYLIGTPRIQLLLLLLLLIELLIALRIGFDLTRGRPVFIFTPGLLASIPCSLQ